MSKELVMINNVCKLCGITQGYHSSKGKFCPVGSKTRIGYTNFSKINKFTPNTVLITRQQ